MSDPLPCHPATRATDENIKKVKKNEKLEEKNHERWRFWQLLTIYGNTMKNWKKRTMKDGAVCPNFIVTYLSNGTPRNVKRGWVCGIYWVQHKSSRNLTPFSGNFIKWIKLCRSIPRWRCLYKLHCHKSLKRGPQGKNVKGLNLLDLSMAIIWYHSIVSTGHISILQTNYVVKFF